MLLTWWGQTKKEYMKEYRNNILLNISRICSKKWNNELKNFEIDVLTNFIKDDDIGGFSDAEVYTDDDGSEEESLDLDKMR